MSTTTQTSFARLTTALTKHGWTFTVVDAQITVPVPGERRAYRGETEQVLGRKVTASNEAEPVYSWEQGPTNFTASFDDNGRYVSATGAYPFGGKSLTKVLDLVSKYSKSSVDAKRVERAQREAEHEAEQDRKVAEAYAEASTKVDEAQKALLGFLYDQVGLSFEQADAVLTGLGDVEGPLVQYQAAKGSQERIGKGWLPGQNSVRGTYVDGKRVG